ncbi:MAG: aerial mycelium formation protein [Actinobacteria bacterium]|nr:aerial mycelium formation protein [Actinomycetota bacterium]
MTEPNGNRRIDRIREPGYLEGLSDLSLEDLRARRDECLAEREYLSLLRRLVQGRAEILKAELEGRAAGGHPTPLVDRLAEILSGEERGDARGEALRVGLPEEEMMLARRRVERLVADAGLSDPTVLDDGSLAEAVELLVSEERELSDARIDVMRILDALQDELKRRYKDDPTLALR